MTAGDLLTRVRAASNRAAASRPARAVAVLVLMVALALLTGTGYDYRPIDALTPASSTVPDDAPAVAQTRTGEARLRSRLSRLKPRGRYIVVDQTNNRLYLREADKVLLEAICSAGSGMVLQDGTSEWVFDTPRGRFEVLSRLEDPIWRKPDWAFVEEGKPVPVRAADRFERGVLGEYALYFGNGFMIHGTLYERLLGRSVTHGCIRLGRDDLRRLWALTKIGTPIYIF